MTPPNHGYPLRRVDRGSGQRSRSWAPVRAETSASSRTSNPLRTISGIRAPPWVRVMVCVRFGGSAPNRVTERPTHCHSSGLREASRKPRLLHHARVSADLPQQHRLPSASHLPERGHDFHTIQEVPGHKDIKATMNYSHVLDHGPMGVSSPADLL